jgi:hypothetical protein
MGHEGCYFAGHFTFKGGVAMTKQWGVNIVEDSGSVP